MTVDTELAAAIKAHLARFDAGIAPSMNEIVYELCPRFAPPAIREAVSALVSAGVVQTRWDKDAWVYWTT